MEHAIPVFMQYGAMGILAIAFVVVLILQVRSDKRAEKYSKHLDIATFDRAQLITVIVANTQSSNALVSQLAAMNKTQDRQAQVIEKLDAKLDRDKCPFIKDKH